MEIILTIGADPTRWFIDGASFGAVASALGRSGPIPVASPLQGQLVLSLQQCGSVALQPPPVTGGGHPTDHPPGGHPTDSPPPVSPHDQGITVVPAPLPLQSPTLYLPSAAGVSLESHGYELPADADLDALVQSIMEAMSDGAVTQVDTKNGLVVLSGAALAFAVVCPPAAAAPSG